MEFAVTLDRIKDEIMIGSKPTQEFPSYDWRMMLIKMGVGAAFALGYWATIRYAMLPNSFKGIHFLNQASYKPTKKQEVAKKIAELDTETVRKLLDVLKKDQSIPSETTTTYTSN